MGRGRGGRAWGWRWRRGCCRRCDRRLRGQCAATNSESRARRSYRDGRTRAGGVRCTPGQGGEQREGNHAPAGNLRTSATRPEQRDTRSEVPRIRHEEPAYQHDEAEDGQARITRSLNQPDDDEKVAEAGNDLFPGCAGSKPGHAPVLELIQHGRLDPLNSDAPTPPCLSLSPLVKDVNPSFEGKG